jgi:hypothetical protein
MGQSHLLPGGAGFNAKWKQLYAAAVFELDDAKLADRIAKARAAMRETADNSPSDEERRTLNDGFRILRVLENMATKENRAA